MCEECDRDRADDPWGYYSHRAKMRHDPEYRSRHKSYREAFEEFNREHEEDLRREAKRKRYGLPHGTV